VRVVCSDLPLNRDQFQSNPSHRIPRIHHLPLSQPASGLRRHPELCQQVRETGLSTAPF
jgi:hypothetical protein